MLENAAPVADGRQRRSEAATVGAEPELVGFAGRTVPEPAPPLAWRVGHHRVGAGVAPGVPRLIPGIDVSETEIAAVRLDVERRDLHLGTQWKWLRAPASNTEWRWAFFT
jgi:hypothetical protein